MDKAAQEKFYRNINLWTRVFFMKTLGESADRIGVHELNDRNTRRIQKLAEKVPILTNRHHKTEREIHHLSKVSERLQRMRLRKLRKQRMSQQ